MTSGEILVVRPPATLRRLTDAHVECLVRYLHDSLYSIGNGEGYVINREFLKAGHLPTLLSAFFYFDMSFMVWVLLGALAVQMSADLGLSAAQKGFMVALPVLAGALLRVVFGVLVDRLRPKLAGIIGQVIVIAGLSIAWLIGINSYQGTLALGLVLGVAGASFAVALPLASRWYPPQFQGTALGIAGAGNSGTVFASLFAPGLAALWG